MHSLLPRGDRPANDPIFALNQEANLRKSRGESIVNATVGVLLDDRGKLAILPTAMRALREVRDEDWAGYAPISGTSSFLDAVMDDLFAHRPTLRACASAVATPGGSGALRHAVCTFLEPGQAMLTTSLYWEPYGVFADENGRRIETFEMFEPRGTASQMYFDDLDRKLGDLLQLQGRALVVLNDPCHNPTGYTMSEHDWFEAARILGKHARGASIAVLLDAAYAAYASRGTRPALQALEPLLDRIPLFVAWSASKTFTQYGLRVGCLAAVVPDADERERVQRALGYACRGTWSTCNSGGMATVTRLLADPELSSLVAFERRAVVEQLDRRVAVFNEMARARSLRFPRYDGGFFVTVFTRDPLAAARKMKDDGVFVVPLHDGVRIALCSIATTDIARLVESLANASAS